MKNAEYKFDERGNLIAIRNIFDRRKWMKPSDGHSIGIMDSKERFYYDSTKKGWYNKEGKQLTKDHKIFN